jgi:alpha-tubulin suppressor-like RCC1 family protein
MPTNFSTSIFGAQASVDDLFVPIDYFRQGNLWLWGDNYYGNMGDNTATQRNTPITTSSGGANWKQVSGGRAHTAAIKTDGTLWVWGNNAYGAIGNNAAIRRSTPVTTFAGGTDWKQVACGKEHTAAIKTDGTLWIWGQNSYGQLGINLSGASNGRTTPVTTFAGGTNWKQVSGGQGHTAAIKTDGTLWTWGENSYGNLGNNEIFSRITPITTFAGGNNWKQVSIGRRHNVAIKTDGTLWSWGKNQSGILGDNTTTQRNTPVTTFAGGTNWKQVAAGYLNTAAIKTDGTLWTWGRNNIGQLGTRNTSNPICTPVTTFAGGTNWKQVSIGYDYMGSIKTDGTLWTWGAGGYGRLGINAPSTKNTPVTTFAGGTNWKQVDCGKNYFAGAVTYIDDYQ